MFCSTFSKSLNVCHLHVSCAAADPALGEQVDQLLSAGRTKIDLPTLADSNDVLMAATSLSNTFICQPQQRNPHGRIFGGFLIR